MGISTVVLIIKTLLVTEILVGSSIVIIILPTIRQLLLPDVQLLPPHPLFGLVFLVGWQLIVLC